MMASMIYVQYVHRHCETWDDISFDQNEKNLAPPPLTMGRNINPLPEKGQKILPPPKSPLPDIDSGTFLIGKIDEKVFEKIVFSA